MPIYEYHCNTCGKDFELLVRSSTDIECPECGNRDLNKKLSAFAIGSSQTQPDSLCSTCGMTPGTCGMDV